MTPIPNLLPRSLLSLPTRAAREPLVVELAADATWSAPATPGGLSIRCERGSVWITVENDPEDHVLAAPGTFSVQARGRVAAMALEPARIVIRRG
jgi:hypothetical protein